MKVTTPLGSFLTPSFEHATVGDAMRPRVLTCEPDTPLVTVAQRMASEHVHAIVVLDEDADAEGQAWSIITDTDVLRAAPRMAELTAAEAASGDLLEARPDEPLADAARRMADHGATHLLVVDDRILRPVGVLSTLDVAGILAWGRA
jgi:CBS domain-containing protein